MHPIIDEQTHTILQLVTQKQGNRSAWSENIQPTAWERITCGKAFFRETLNFL